MSALQAPRSETRTAPAAASLVMPIKPGPGRLTHVLIVDDNELNRKVAQSFCDLLGFTSGFARDGVEAVEAVGTGGFDLILMDVSMPRMDGVEATQVIRAMPGELAKIPIIALTANAEPSEVRACLEAGMHSVIQKPVRLSRLFDAVCDVFEHAPLRTATPAA